MGFRTVARSLLAAGSTVAALGVAGTAAAGQTILQETNPLLWTLIAISFAGAIITFAIMIYALWKFRDPTTRRRRYG